MKPNQRILAWARKEIVDLKPYASAREEFELDKQSMILLDANENPFQNGLNRYPDPLQKNLKKRLAEYKQCTPENIFLSNGSDEFFHQLMLVFCRPAKDQIMILPPTFGMYKVCADINAIQTLEVPLTSNFQLDVEAILAQKKKNTKAIFIPSPNNPTGNCFAKADIKAIIEGFDGLVVVDEAYVEFAEGKSVLPWLGQYDNLVVTQTFSKAQGMAGARLGMAFAHPTLIDLLNKVKAPYNINTMTQEKILQRLDEQGVVTQQVQQLLEEKERVLAELKHIRYIHEIYPSDANFIMIRVDDSQQRYDRLIAEGIVVRNPSKNVNCENTLRITIGLQEENNALLGALRNMDI